MSQEIRCDGCDVITSKPGIREDSHTIHGERLPERSSGPGRIPMGEFDWCQRCAQIAFTAVAEAKRQRNGAGAARVRAGKDETR
jgi:hypothetical protein